MNKKAFSLVEMIIVITIVILLSVIATSINSNLKTKTLNTRTTADIDTLNNALTSYGQENSDLPPPSWNTNWFKQDTSYTEAGVDAFGVYGQVTSDTLPARYLDIVPLDQFTGAFYAYGKTLNDSSAQFEVAGILRDSGNPTAVVTGNYSAQTGPYNLIREYNGPNFVYDESGKYFPYNPDELALNARITEIIWNAPWYRVGDIIEEWQTITVDQDSQATLYFWDGSRSVLWDPDSETTLVLTELSYPQDGNSLISKISLALNAGTIWTNATQMWQDAWSSSEFSIQTWDTTAAVRGTIFGIQYLSENSQTIQVVSGEVKSYNSEEYRSSDDPVETAVFKQDTSNNWVVPSINSEISEWTGELTSTLKTQVISYNFDEENQTGIVTLESNDVFKYDAEYLKVSDLQILNPRKISNSVSAWLIDSPEQSSWDDGIFDISQARWTEVSLAFCKTLDGTEICTRSTSVARQLSYVTQEVDGTAICSLTATQATELTNLWYTSVPEADKEFARFDLAQQTKPVLNPQNVEIATDLFSLKIECVWTDARYDEAEDKKLLSRSCNPGFTLNANCDPLSYSGDHISGEFNYTIDDLTFSIPQTIISLEKLNSTAHQFEKRSAEFELNTSWEVVEVINTQQVSFARCETETHVQEGAVCVLPELTLACTSATPATPDGYKIITGEVAHDAPVTLENTNTLPTGFTAQYKTAKCINNEFTNVSSLITSVDCTIGFSKDGITCNEIFASCNLTDGWKFNGQTSVPHSPTTPKFLIKEITEDNSFVRYEGSTTCNNGIITLPDNTESYQFTQYSNVVPGTLLSSLSQAGTVDLNENFKITINIDNIQTSSNIQYILFNSDNDIKLYITANWSQTCITNDSNIDKCYDIWASTQLYIYKKSDNKLYLKIWNWTEINPWKTVSNISNANTTLAWYPWLTFFNFASSINFKFE